MFAVKHLMKCLIVVQIVDEVEQQSNECWSETDECMNKLYVRCQNVVISVLEFCLCLQFHLENVITYNRADYLALETKIS